MVFAFFLSQAEVKDEKRSINCNCMQATELLHL